MKFEYIGLTNAPLKEVGQATFQTVNALQDFKPHTQAAALAAAFLLVCEAWKVPPQEVFVAAKNMLVHEQDGTNEHFRAVKLYLENEVLK